MVYSVELSEGDLRKLVVSLRQTFYGGELRKRMFSPRVLLETGSPCCEPVSTVYGLDMVVVVPSNFVSEMLKCSL